jgi:hypothetical protein
LRKWRVKVLEGEVKQYGGEDNTCQDISVVTNFKSDFALLRLGCAIFFFLAFLAVDGSDALVAVCECRWALKRALKSGIRISLLLSEGLYE